MADNPTGILVPRILSLEYATTRTNQLPRIRAHGRVTMLARRSAEQTGCDMPIQYPEGAVKLKEPRVEKALDYLLAYQTALRDLFLRLPNEARRGLSKVPNPHLATGPAELFVCSNGVVASIRNGLIAPDITAKVTLPDAPSMTMVEYFNSNVEWFFTFMDPISKLSFKGHTASFADPSAFEGQLVQLIITDALDGVWLPHASKVFLMGWGFFDHGDFRAKAQEAAGIDLANAYGLNNLRSPVAAKRLLEEYRRLLETATNEATLQTFLESHPEFVYPEHAQLISKPSLGGEREPDFAFSIGSAFGPRWVFVEIERPDKQIFTKAQNFQFSHQFTQAKGQLLQWDTLITQDHPYFARRFQGLQKPEFHLVYGRDSELDESRRQMLAAEFSAAANRTFSTFDDLASRFETIVNRIFPAIP